MCRKKSEREFFRKLLEIFFVKKPLFQANFGRWITWYKKESRFYNALNRLKNIEALFYHIEAQYYVTHASVLLHPGYLL
jgi:hypothetical protein